MASTFKKNLCSVFIFIEAIVFLLPLSWMCGMGFMAFFMGMFSSPFSGGEGLDRRFWGEGALLLAASYGLYALWWLVFTHRGTSLSEVPRLVWGGIAVGCAIALHQLYGLFHDVHVSDKASTFELFSQALASILTWLGVQARFCCC